MKTGKHDRTAFDKPKLKMKMFEVGIGSDGWLVLQKYSPEYYTKAECWTYWRQSTTEGKYINEVDEQILLHRDEAWMLAQYILRHFREE